MYRPVTAHSDFGILGFSSIDFTFLFSSNSITPNLSGSLTLQPKIVAPELLLIAFFIFSIPSPKNKLSPRIKIVVEF